MDSYFVRTGSATFRPTEHVSGAWNPDEQHISPAMGVMAHLIEQDRDLRRSDRLVMSRLSYDILGTVPMDEISIAVSVLRPGRTIELVEARLTYAERSIVVLRAWLMQRLESSAVATAGFEPIPPPDAMPEWSPTVVWPGGFIASADARRIEQRPGRASYWVRPKVTLLDEPASPMASAAGLIDIANGMTVLAEPGAVAFPNVDLTAHFLREPRSGWLGFDTTVAFGPTGQGVTESVLHDTDGPVGTMSQILTVRPS